MWIQSTFSLLLRACLNELLKCNGRTMNLSITASLAQHILSFPGLHRAATAEMHKVHIKCTIGPLLHILEKNIGFLFAGLLKAFGKGMSFSIFLSALQGYKQKHLHFQAISMYN